MINFNDTYDALRASRLEPHVDTIKAGVRQRFAQYKHGKLSQWLELVKSLPELKPCEVELNSRVKIGTARDAKDHLREKLEQSLKELHPWRKGPYSLFGVDIETEWHSDWKWDRLKSHITNLRGRMVLDVGCGNGYHLWRMIGADARLALGIDPSQLFMMQFAVMQNYLPGRNAHFLPIGIEHMPANLNADGFDTVFSMGILYHRRSPIDHLLHLKSLLRPGGELVLETLVIEGKTDEILVPTGRYAQMNNVWFIPSPGALTNWLQRCDFRKVRVVNESKTSTEEQRATDWMTFQSLPDFLDPGDPNKTIEGYPAPRRAIIVAERPA